MGSLTPRVLNLVPVVGRQMWEVVIRIFPLFLAQ
jgi:hypothetical protein